MRYDALVIGAGMSGLAAGIRLAQFDRRVAVLERHYLWGGLNSFYKRAGRRLDTGLHALTNFVPPGVKGAPLPRILRQLRISRDELALGEHRVSRIHFGGLDLRFSNEIELLTEEVAAAFPGSADAFRAVCGEVAKVDLGDMEPDRRSARAVLLELLPDAHLVNALLLPALWYGSPREDDLDWHSFCILFRSIFLEGLSRPDGGVKRILDVLRGRYEELGGELRMRSGVAEILVEDGRARGVRLDDGDVLEADLVLSSAGWVETQRLARRPEPPPAEVGRISFVETISVLDRTPADLGVDDAVIFYQLGDELRYRVPGELCDLDSGVVSIPNNYDAETPPAEGMLRVTTLANHAGWAGLPEQEYVAQKASWSDRALEAVRGIAADVRPHEVYRDTFSPRTIEHYTGHVNGTVYGSPVKRVDGATGVDGLVLCGTDQGFVGVIGALLSGISMANRYGLMTGSPA